MTDPTGRCFISYKSERREGARLLGLALRERGVPTWLDTEDLGPGVVEGELRRVIDAAETSGAVLWITPEVAASPMILEVEARAILARAREVSDPFFVLPVAAGGLSWQEAAAALEGVRLALSPRALRFEQVADPLTQEEAARLAMVVLRRRLSLLHSGLPAGTPLRLRLNTREKPGAEPGVALSLDWSHAFTGREAPAEAWNGRLLPALRETAHEVKTSAPGRPVEAFGLPALGAAVALGVAFPRRGSVSLAWRQHLGAGRYELWNLDVERQPCGFEARIDPGDVTGREVALLIAVNGSVEAPFAKSCHALPQWRCLVRMTPEPGASHPTLSAGQAADLAHRTSEALRKARDDYDLPSATLHLFLAAPAGLAVMLGQLLNTFAAVQTYEYTPEDERLPYHAAARLRPNL